MDNYIEYFVKNFIIKDKRERILHEFAKKPHVAAWRICHGLYGLFDERLVVLSGKKLTEAEVLSEIKKHTKDKDAFILTAFDEQIKPLDEAVQICFDDPSGSVLITEGAVLWKTELDYGAPEKFVLAK